MTFDVIVVLNGRLSGLTIQTLLVVFKLAAITAPPLQPRLEQDRFAADILKRWGLS
jgi:hypothetical protein